MQIFKINRNRDYTVMSNYHLRDKNLSYKAKGMLSFMLSLPDDWDYSLNGLISISKENRDAIRNILNELKSHNYLKIKRSRNRFGRFEYIYTIFENPCESTLKKQNLPDTGFSPTVNHLQINTKQRVDNIDKIDKTKSHNLLTRELMNQKFISEDDISSFYFDELFESYLKSGYSYVELISSIHYIVPRIIKNDFRDENGEPIENKYGYFKEALASNFSKLDKLNQPLYDIENEER